MRRFALWFLIASWALPLPAKAQSDLEPLPPDVADDMARPPPPVSIRIAPLFGPAVAFSGELVPTLVTLENQTPGTLEGDLVVEPMRFGAIPRRRGTQRGSHRVRVRLPGASTRTVELPLVTSDTRPGWSARFLGTEGAALADAQSLQTHRRMHQRVVLMLPEATPLRLLLERIAAGTTKGPMPRDPTPAVAPAVPEGEGSPFRLPVSFAGVPTDPNTGDPMVPRDPRGWHAADLIIAQTDAVVRLPAAHRRALVDFVELGAQLALIPSGGAGDLDRQALGPLVRGTALPIAFGTQRALGAGTVFVLDRAPTPATPSEDTLRALFRHLEFRGSPTHGGAEPWARPIAGTWLGFPGRAVEEHKPNGRRQREVLILLDPNHDHQRWLGLYALLLIAYTLSLVPLGLGRRRGRRRPLDALYVTPLLALGVTVALLTVAFLGKGPWPRAHRIELVEAATGADRGVWRRYTGLFPTVPRGFDLTPPSGTMPVVLGGDGGAEPEEVRHGATGPTLAGVRAGLWETRFFREDGLTSLDGRVDLETEEGRVVAIRNGLDTDLLGVVLFRWDGMLVPVGDIKSGEVRDVTSSTARFHARELRARGRDAYVGRLARMLGAGDVAPTVLGRALGAMADEDPFEYGYRPPPPGRPAAILARWPRTAEAPALAEAGFPIARDMRFLRVTEARETPGPALGDGRQTDLDVGVP